MELISERLLKALALTLDYYKNILESSLYLGIPNVPSNNIGQQAWCVIGARESYLKALNKGSWDGFSCSLQNPFDKKLVVNKLEETSADLQSFLETAKVESLNLDLMFDLLEHEVQHHGQLIRFSYANKLGFPESWNKRYTV